MDALAAINIQGVDSVSMKKYFMQSGIELGLLRIILQPDIVYLWFEKLR
jgi:hypothetical protein